MAIERYWLCFRQLNCVSMKAENIICIVKHRSSIIHHMMHVYIIHWNSWGVPDSFCGSYTARWRVQWYMYVLYVQSQGCREVPWYRMFLSAKTLGAHSALTSSEFFLVAICSEFCFVLFCYWQKFSQFLYLVMWPHTWPTAKNLGSRWQAWHDGYVGPVPQCSALGEFFCSLLGLRSSP